MGARSSCEETWKTSLGPDQLSGDLENKLGSSLQRPRFWGASALGRRRGPGSARAPAWGRSGLKPWLERSQPWPGPGAAHLSSRHSQAQLGAAFQPEASLACLGLSGPGRLLLSLELVFPTAVPQPRSCQSRRAAGVQQPPCKSMDNRDFPTLSDTDPVPCKQQFSTQRGKGTSPRPAQHHYRGPDHHPSPPAPPQSAWLLLELGHSDSLGLKPQPLLSSLEHSSHEWAVKPRSLRGGSREPLAFSRVGFAGRHRALPWGELLPAGPILLSLRVR